MKMRKAMGICMTLTFAAGILFCCGQIKAQAVKTEPTPEYVLTYAENQAENYPTVRRITGPPIPRWVIIR